MKDINTQLSTSDCVSTLAVEQKSQRGRKKSTASKVNKKERRLMQNRVSAFRFRIKRKQEYETLKDQVQLLVSENEALKQQVTQLRLYIEQNQKEPVKNTATTTSMPTNYTAVLLQQLQKLQSEIGSYQQLTGFNRQQQPLLGGAFLGQTQNFTSNDSSTIVSSSSSPVLKPTYEQNLNLSQHLFPHIYQQARIQNPLLLVKNTQDMSSGINGLLQKSPYHFQPNSSFSTLNQMVLLNETNLTALNKK